MLIGAGSFKEIAMHGPGLCTRVMVLLMAVGAAGCLPNRMAISPDGQTLYFAVNADAHVSGGGNSNVYALDVGGGRIRALSGGPGLKGCCSLSTNGRYLAYSQKQNEGRLYYLFLKPSNMPKEPLAPTTAPPATVTTPAK